jgi:hypothetical protein
MNRPAPSLAILAVLALVLALVFFGREYVWPEHQADARGRAAVAGYNGSSVAAPSNGDDAATMAGMMDAGRLWAKKHRPNSVAGCPALPEPFHKGCVSAVTARD